MAKKRIKYNWLYMIKDLNLQSAFDSYCEKHKGISINRCARGFICHFKKILPYKCGCYIVGQEAPYDEWLEMQAIIRTPWLD